MSSRHSSRWGCRRGTQPGGRGTAPYSPGPRLPSRVHRRLHRTTPGISSPSVTPLARRWKRKILDGFPFGASGSTWTFRGNLPRGQPRMLRFTRGTPDADDAMRPLLIARETRERRRSGRARFLSGGAAISTPGVTERGRSRARPDRRCPMKRDRGTGCFRIGRILKNRAVRHPMGAGPHYFNIFP